MLSRRQIIIAYLIVSKRTLSRWIEWFMRSSILCVIYALLQGKVSGIIRVEMIIFQLPLTNVFWLVLIVQQQQIRCLYTSPSDFETLGLPQYLLEMISDGVLGALVSRCRWGDGTRNTQLLGYRARWPSGVPCWGLIHAIVDMIYRELSDHNLHSVATSYLKLVYTPGRLATGDHLLQCGSYVRDGP